MHASDQTFYFVTTLQGRAYKTQPREMHHARLMISFVTTLQERAYMRDAARPRTLRFKDAHTGVKRRLDSGI